MNENKNQIKRLFTPRHIIRITDACVIFLLAGRIHRALCFCNFAPRIVREVIVDDGAEKTRRYLIGGTDANGNNFTPCEVPCRGT